MANELIDSNWLVSTVFERYPQTLPVFLQWKLDCFGCSMADFCTLADVAEDYHLDLPLFVQALHDSISE